MKQYDLSKVSQLDTGDFHIECGWVDGDFEMHSHDFCEIFLVLSGSGIHLSGETEYPLWQGKLFAVKGSERHGFRNCRRLHIINIMFRVSSLPVAQCRELPGFWALFLHEQQSGTISYVLLREESFQKAYGWCQDMLREYRSCERGRAAMCHALLTQLVIFLSRACGTLPENLEHPDYRLANALIHLESHYTEHMDLGRLALMAGFSTRHFTRLFRQYYHQSPMEYLLRVRIGHAYRLLEESDCSISQVAEACGFSDSSHFSRVFKAHTSCSPFQWKKRR